MPIRLAPLQQIRRAACGRRLSAWSLCGRERLQRMAAVLAQIFVEYRVARGRPRTDAGRKTIL